MIAGAIMLVLPIVYPSQYLAAPVFLGFAFLLDPLNARMGAESILGDLRERHPGRLINLLVAGLVCGFAWELWNYWAGAKWIYSVPILPAPSALRDADPGLRRVSRVRRRMFHDVRDGAGVGLARRGTPHLDIIRGSALGRRGPLAHPWCGAEQRS